MSDWQAVIKPQACTLLGRYCDVVPLSIASHAPALYAANCLDDGRMWTYLPYGPFDHLSCYQAWLTQYCRTDDPLFYVIIDKKIQQAVGMASFLRIDSANGVIEIGHIAYSPVLKRSTAATEAMFLMAEYIFSLGYRRYEWKCNALNTPSCSAATRFGFQFEGIFRQAGVVKGHNRDTAWYAIINSDWPALKSAYQTWLADANFNENGQQLVSLTKLTAAII